jgi:hypothetical protein
VNFPTLADALSNRFSVLMFHQSSHPGVETHPDPDDLAAQVRSIKDAKAQADYVLTSIHSHEAGPGANPDARRDTPSQFLVEFAHAAVDAGTDVFIGHGPHVLRGIEIYKGKVILYSLGDFWFENHQILRWPSDWYRWYGLDSDARPSEGLAFRNYIGDPADPHNPFWQTVVAKVMFHDGHPTEVILTPVAISVAANPSQYGTPKLADPHLGKEILEHLQAMSKPFGTNIEIRDGLGIINIGASRP